MFGIQFSQNRKIDSNGTLSWIFYFGIFLFAKLKGLSIKNQLFNWTVKKLFTLLTFVYLPLWESPRWSTYTSEKRFLWNWYGSNVQISIRLISLLLSICHCLFQLLWIQSSSCKVELWWKSCFSKKNAYIKLLVIKRFSSLIREKMCNYVITEIFNKIKILCYVISTVHNWSILYTSVCIY